MAKLTEFLIDELVQTYGTPLLVVDCKQLATQVEQLRAALPNVDLYYALKAFSDTHIIRELDAMGVGFDIASSGEADLLYAMKVNPRQTIHTHPIKTDDDIRQALRFGCTTFVIDNFAELQKFIPYRSRVGLLIRVAFRSSEAVVDLSKKFGCDPGELDWLVAEASRLDLAVKGFSFHVGSQCSSPSAHVHAIETCAQRLREWQTRQPQLSVLDIGGGFPVSYQNPSMAIEDFCQPIRQALKQVPDEVRIIAEPGRYLVAPTAYAISRVIGKATRGAVPWYYLDDGVYGNYSGQIFDSARYPIHVFKQGAKQPSILAGPTCDSIDIVAENIMLPELAIGDVVIGSNMGAYTHATSTHFNRLRPAQVICINEQAQQPSVAFIG